MLFCSVNDQQVDHIAVTDRGLAYGDGFFTTAKITSGKIELLTEHINRLKTSSQLLAISDINFQQLSVQLCDIAQQFQLAVLKVMITAGSGGRGYARPKLVKPNIIITVHEFPKHYLLWQQQGITVANAKTQLGLNPLFQGLKHLNRLEQVLVRQELENSDYDDLLVSDFQGNVIETTCANVFWCVDKIWHTPKLTHAGVDGIYRRKILSFADNIQQVNVNSENLSQANSMFICNSVMGIVPVSHFHQQAFDINEVERFIKNIGGLNG